ncbi:MAG: DNA primase [Rhodospirillales bacterium]|nr:DNA primase [Rhodospirillales bacterium]
MNITPRFLDELRNRILLSELVGQHVRLTRAGREFKGCCPFHKEKTASFYVNDDKQFYHCFGCGAHGDVIGWTMQHGNRSFPEAIEQLAAQAGLEMPKQSPQDIKQAREEKNLYQLMEDATAFFEEQLRDLRHKPSYDYILGRGLTEETLSAFRVGYASEDRQALYHHLKTKGYTDAQMMEMGVIRKDKKGQPYAFFRERIMFPVSDRRGRIVAFGGRILPDHLRPPDQSGYTPAKYMNSIDTPLFHKGRMLYGAAHAAYAAREGAPLIVTEGYMDVIACWQAGFRGAVAPLGTALTEEQILVLWRLSMEEVKAPVLCFDGDEAGRRAAMRAAERRCPLKTRA